MKSRPFHKKRHISCLKSCEHPWHIGNIHIVQLEFDLFRPQQEVVHDCGVLVLDLVVVQLGNVLLAEGVDQERRHEGEEPEEGAGSEHHGGVGGGVCPEDGLDHEAHAAGGQGEGLDQLDLGCQNTVVDLLLGLGVEIVAPAGEDTGPGHGDLGNNSLYYIFVICADNCCNGDGESTWDSLAHRGEEVRAECAPGAMLTPASLVTRDTGLLELGAGAVVTRPVLLSSCWTSRDMLLSAHSSGKYTCRDKYYGENEPDARCFIT